MTGLLYNAAQHNVGFTLMLAVVDPEISCCFQSHLVAV